jgi:hypothetical protein
MSTKRFNPDVEVVEWTGRQRPYDILKEGTIALIVVSLLVVTLAVLFGSPDDAPVTIRQWSNADPIDFATTAFTELAGTSATATYGAPYNHVPATGQSILGVSLENLVGVHIPINTANDFVLIPLAAQTDDRRLTAALSAWRGATPTVQAAWIADYAAHEPTTVTRGHLIMRAHHAGPVPVLIASLTQMAQSGALDQALLTNNQRYYSVNYTEPLLFLANGNYFSTLAGNKHLAGNQWGMMNETGNYPGQAWLWLYTFWYQIKPFSTSASGDFMVWALMMLASVIMVFVPFIPGVRSIPRRIKIYRLIWRDHYRHAGR